jgi:hypothetical protein
LIVRTDGGPYAILGEAHERAGGGQRLRVVEHGQAEPSAGWGIERQDAQAGAVVGDRELGHDGHAQALPHHRADAAGVAHLVVAAQSHAGCPGERGDERLAAAGGHDEGLVLEILDRQRLARGERVVDGEHDEQVVGRERRRQQVVLLCGDDRKVDGTGPQPVQHLRVGPLEERDTRRDGRRRTRAGAAA